MKKLDQSEYQKFIENSRIAVLVISRDNCPSCDSLKKTMLPRVQEKLPAIPFAEFEGEDIYPVNELSKKFGFRTVPTVIIFKEGIPKKCIKGVTFSEEYIQEIQKFM